MSEEPRTVRRLAAILAADVAGYSRLMGQDEEGTLAALNGHRRELIDPLIARHEGRIVKTTGDGLLLEFASVIDALRCAIVVQQGMEDRNATVEPEKRIRFRVGINVGDVIVEEGDLFGDGVNVAARLETLADPGTICVSATVREYVGDKLPVAFVDLGDHQVKNIARPIHAYRVDAGPERAGNQPPISRPVAPDRPSIAVLPFDNMSGDPEQEYFADGMTEDIITGLSRFSQLFVIARNTMFTYKGKAIDMRQVAAELGVRYVLEGSVRRAGNRVRITGQLIDAETGGHVWGDRFDGELEDVFDLQDKVTGEVVGVIEPAIRKAELDKLRRQSPEHMGAYDYYLQALSLMIRAEKDTHPQVFELLQRSLELDPAYAPALALSAWCLEFGVTRGWQPLTDDDRALGIEQAKAVLSSDSGDENAVAIAGFALQQLSGDFDAGSAAAHRAIGLNPNSAVVQMFAGLALVFAGEAGKARACFERARLLSPADPAMSIFLFGIGASCLAEGEYEQAVEYSRQAMALRPEREGASWIAVAANAKLGRPDKARKALDFLCAMNPEASNLAYWQRLPFRDSAVKKALIEGAKRAIEGG